MKNPDSRLDPNQDPMLEMCSLSPLLEKVCKTIAQGLEAGGGSASQGGLHDHVHDSIWPFRLTVALGLKMPAAQKPRSNSLDYIPCGVFNISSTKAKHPVRMISIDFWQAWTIQVQMISGKETTGCLLMHLNMPHRVFPMNSNFQRCKVVLELLVVQTFALLPPPTLLVALSGESPPLGISPPTYVSTPPASSARRQRSTLPLWPKIWLPCCIPKCSAETSGWKVLSSH